MPKYIINTPTFNPIDFETRIKPMAAYADTFNKNLEALDQSAIAGDAIGGLIDPNKDKELADVYNSYNTLLNDTVDTMLNSGDVGRAKGNLRTLRSKYANELIPIQQGYASWQNAIKAYDDRKAKDLTFIGTDPRKYSISNYMKGQSPSDHAVSGQLLYSQGLNDAKAASARRVITDKWKLSPELMGQYFDRMKKVGFSQDELASGLKDVIIAQRGTLEGVTNEDINTVAGYIKDSFKRVGKANGIDKLDDNNFKMASNYLYNGILAGLSYNEDDKTLKNEDHLNPLEAASLTEKNINNQILRMKLNAASKPTSGDGDDVSTYYTVNSAYDIIGDVSKYSEMAQALGDLFLGKVDINSKTGKRISDYTVTGSGTAARYQPSMRDETYGDKIYNLAKDLGQTNVSREEFINALQNMSSEELSKTLESYQEMIVENAKRYNVYSSKMVDKAQEDLSSLVNQSNASVIQDSKKQSLIYDSKGKRVNSIPEHGVYELPRTEEEAKKGLIYRGKNDKEEFDNKYYVAASAFGAETKVTIPSLNVRMPLGEAIKLYVELLNPNSEYDAMLASEVAANIFQAIGAAAVSFGKAQSDTDAKL